MTQEESSDTRVVIPEGRQVNSDRLDADNSLKAKTDKSYTISIEDIGIIPKAINKLSEQLDINEDLSFSTIDELRDYLKKRQNIFTYALERFSWNKDKRMTDFGYPPENSFGWEKKDENKIVDALSNEDGAMFTGKDLCTTACISLIDFIKATCGKDVKVHLIKVWARKTGATDQMDKPFEHNIVMVHFDNDTLLIDPTFRQINPDALDPFLFSQDASDQNLAQYEQKDGEILFVFEDDTIASSKQSLPIIGPTAEYMQQVLRLTKKLHQ